MTNYNSPTLAAGPGEDKEPLLGYGHVCNLKGGEFLCRVSGRDLVKHRPVKRTPYRGRQVIRMKDWKGCLPPTRETSLDA